MMAEHGIPRNLKQTSVLSGQLKCFTQATLPTRSFQGRPMRLWRRRRSVRAEWNNSDGGRRENEVKQKKRVRKIERPVRQRRDSESRKGVERQGETVERGWRNWQSSYWQQWGLLTIQEYCLKSICHRGAVEPVITTWYSPFHSDNLFSAFPVHLTAALCKGQGPLSISVCQSVSLLNNWEHRAVQSFYQWPDDGPNRSAPGPTSVPLVGLWPSAAKKILLVST